VRRRRLLALAAGLVVAGGALLLLLPGGQRAPGPPRLETALQDDALLLYGTPAGVRRTAERLAAIGVDRVRLTAGWSVIAPEPLSPVRPRFDARDPADYPPEGFGRLDRAVSESRRAGLQVMIDVAFWAPRWAVERPVGAPERQRFRPSPQEFGRFAEAVARRYDGHFEDPATGARLPAVRLFTTWNEPNHSTFLLPQWERRNGRWLPASPHLYRAMHEAAYAAIKRVSGEDRVLIGGLTSRGSTERGTARSIPPLLFTRELACVDSRLRPLRRPECRGFKPLRADGFAHHPYSFTTPPDTPSPDPDSVTMADLPRLSRLLEELYERGRLAQRLPIYITEYGFESDPPDPFRGVPLETQARWMSQAESIAYARPDVRMFAQFLLRDLGPDRTAARGSRARWRQYQTGLLFPDGRPKPALRAFELPFFASRAANGVHAFGQVRPGTGRQRVAIEERGAGDSWKAGPTFSTDGHGFFVRPLPGPGTYRLRWERAGGEERSQAVTVR
jgi:hypothetical protein